MERIENEFLVSEIVKPWLWLRYIDDIFFIWIEGEDKLEGFLNRLNNFHPNLKLKQYLVNFLDLSVSIADSKLENRFISWNILILINHSFNCDSKCLIYPFSFIVYGIQYKGYTVNRFRLKWNNNKSCQRNATDGKHPTKTISINILKWRS